jgi:Tripartite tricarboxylate transporter family receptor
MVNAIARTNPTLQSKKAIVVENKPGAATNLGADFVAKAAPDGYTVLLGDVATYAANPSLYQKLQFDPHADAWLRGDARGRNGSLPQKLGAGPARWLAARHRRPSGPISSAAEGSTTRSISNADFLSPVDQLGQFLSGIEHTCFYSRGWHVENVRYFVDRLLVVIDQVDDLTMLRRQSNQCSAHQFAPILFLQCAQLATDRRSKNSCA